MMDILAGRKSNKGLSGTVTMNGYLITPAITSKYLSYIQQVMVFWLKGSSLPSLSADF